MKTKKHNGNKIDGVRNNYGDTVFRMALAHLFDAGCMHITAKAVENAKASIMAEEEKGIPIMTKEFRCALLDIALELAQFTIWDLLYYVKHEVYIG